MNGGFDGAKAIWRTLAFSTLYSDLTKLRGVAQKLIPHVFFFSPGNEDSIMNLQVAALIVLVYMRVV